MPTGGRKLSMIDQLLCQAEVYLVAAQNALNDIGERSEEYEPINKAIDTALIHLTYWRDERYDKNDRRPS